MSKSLLPQFWRRYGETHRCASSTLSTLGTVLPRTPDIPPQVTRLQLRHRAPAEFTARLLGVLKSFWHLAVMVLSLPRGESFRILLRVDWFQKLLGLYAEQRAARLLEKSGYFVWKTNWRCRVGELDLIAYRGRTLVIVEVKSLSQTAISTPLAKVDMNKQQKILRLVRRFLTEEQREIKARRLREVRIDVVAVHFDLYGGTTSLTHVQDAFRMDFNVSGSSQSITP